MQDEQAFRMTLFALVAVQASIGGYFRVRARISGGVVSRKKETAPIFWVLRLSGLGAWGGVLVYLINPAWMRWSQWPLPDAARWVGAALLLLATGWLWWVFSTLGNNVTDTVETRTAHTLVTDGPYRFVRHPLYAAGIPIVCGWSLIMASWYMPLLGIVACAALVLRTRIEEEQLVARFGDAYLQYMQRTGRFFPRFGRGAT